MSVCSGGLNNGHIWESDPGNLSVIQIFPHFLQKKIDPLIQMLVNKTLSGNVNRPCLIKHTLEVILKITEEEAEKKCVL